MAASTVPPNTPPLSHHDTSPYVLAVISHKGGTGRTTLAMALAWLWGQRGFNVTLVDADPVNAASIVAAGPSGVCPWTNVNLVIAHNGEAHIPLGQDVVIIDTPAATEPLAQKVLNLANGVIVCCLADSLALYTLPAATQAIQKACTTRPDLELLGIVVNLFDEADDAQVRCLSFIRDARGGLFVEPPVPRCQDLSDWPLTPGSDLPDGVARPSLATLADTFSEMIAEAGWKQFAERKGGQRAYAAHR